MKENLRTYNSLRNIGFSMGLGFIAIIISFITQKVFLDQLSVNYLGINGLLMNIISMLAISEAGFGTAMIYHLYKPLAENDDPMIHTLMRFYKKGYWAIAGVVLAVGLMFMPLLPAVTGKTSVPVNLNLVYVIFLGNAVVTYLLSYKRSILFADQKNYLINIARISSMIVLNSIQILILLRTQNYYLFLIAMFAVTLLENVALNRIIDRLYPILAIQVEPAPIDIKTKQDIYRKVKGLIYHNVGTFLVNGTDSLIISMFLGIKFVGLYSNYLLVLKAILSMVSQISTAIIASIGNLLLTKDKAKHYQVFKNVQFGNFWVCTVVCALFFTCINPFITLWLGKEYALSLGVVTALSIYLYLTLARSAMHSFKTAAGIFHEDRYIPLLEAGVNIVASILLLHYYGLAGVIMGSICSSLVLHLYSYPRYVYIRLFDRNYLDYFTELSAFLGLPLFIGLLVFSASNAVTIESSGSNLIMRAALGFMVPNTVLFIWYRRTTEYEYFKNLAKTILKI